MDIEKKINDWLSKKGLKDESSFLNSFKKEFLVNPKYTKSEFLSKLVDMEFVKNIEEAERIFPVLLDTTFKKTEKIQERFFEISGSMYNPPKYQLREYYR